MYMNNKTFADGVKYVRSCVGSTKGQEARLICTGLIWDFKLRAWKNSRNEFLVGMHTECLRIIENPS